MLRAALSRLRLVILGAAAVALAACAGPIPQLDGRPVLITITAGGAGPIGPGTSYSGAQIRALLPGYDVDGLAMATEDAVQSAFGVYANGALQMQILPGSGNLIGAIHGVGLSVAGPNGERIGHTYAQIQPIRSTCRVGTGNWVGLPICRARGASNIDLVFAVPGATTAAFPSEAALRNAVLTRIVWEPA
jgi:hypothetical protein